MSMIIVQMTLAADYGLVTKKFEDGLEGKSMSDTIMISEDAFGLDITMQQFFARLCCQDAVDKTVVLLHLSVHATRKHVAVLDSWRFCKKPRKGTVNGRPCRLQHADAPINSIRQASMMTWCNTIVEKNPTQGRVVAIKRGFHPLLQLTWNTNARVLRANFEIHAHFVLRKPSHQVQDR